MLVRLVKLPLHPDHVASFLNLFDEIAPKIRAFDGCIHLELLQHVDFPGVVCTYSHWHSESHLDNYRQSDLFKENWAKTKPMFAAPPRAESYRMAHSAGQPPLE